MLTRGEAGAENANGKDFSVHLLFRFLENFFNFFVLSFCSFLNFDFFLNFFRKLFLNFYNFFRKLFRIFSYFLKKALPRLCLRFVVGRLTPITEASMLFGLLVVAGFSGLVGLKNSDSLLNLYNDSN